MADYSGFIIVKVTERAQDSPSAHQRITDIAQREVKPLITSLSAAEIRSLDDIPAVEDTDTPDSLGSYLRVDARHSTDGARQQLLEELRRSADVEDTYLELAVVDPSPNDPLASQQGHLKAAPQGTDAEYGWTQLGGHGDIEVIDLEQGWFLDHQDLPTRTSLPGVPVDSNPVDKHRDHGTAASGLAVATTNNSIGIAGISAPHNRWSVASHYDAATATNGHVANAIAAVLHCMKLGKVKPGSVLMLEVERAGLPTEVDSADKTAILKACRSGLIVVEAAGNGNKNLDNVPALVKDSGAVVVGASKWNPCTSQHFRWLAPAGPAGSNFGTRVNCFALGDRVITAGYGTFDPGTGPNDRYGFFFATSAATAIVAGVAVLIQNVRKSQGKAPLKPSAMRTVLQVSGTPSLPSSEPIGVMPNLQPAILAAMALP